MSNAHEIPDPTPESKYLGLLLNEGLELLASYRQIGDPAIRLRLRDLAKSLADERRGAAPGRRAAFDGRSRDG